MATRFWSRCGHEIKPQRDRRARHCESRQARQTDEVQGGGSYASQSDFRLHFGLGAATKVDELEIHWPGGGVEKLSGIAANQSIRVREGDGIIHSTAFVTSTRQ